MLGVNSRTEPKPSELAGTQRWLRSAIAVEQGSRPCLAGSRAGVSAIAPYEVSSITLDWIRSGGHHVGRYFQKRYPKASRWRFQWLSIRVPERRRAKQRCFNLPALPDGDGDSPSHRPHFPFCGCCIQPQTCASGVAKSASLKRSPATSMRAPSFVRGYCG